MECWSLNRSTITSCAVAAMLAACSGSQPPIATSPTRAQSQALSYPTLYSFGKLFSGGREPKAALIDVNGTLYGTTFAGGSTVCVGGCGTVFTITLSGKEKVLYRFKGRSDGANPSASLLAVRGLLYGTTEYGGGKVDGGTVFEISTTGVEKVLHPFGYDGDKRYHKDGANPVASLIDVKGELYGTTVDGGSSGSGTVFRISTSGKEKVLHSFGLDGDGANPVASLINVKGSFYGTTRLGGGGYGTVFSVSATGTEKVIHEFSYGPNGGYPDAALVNVKGTLYGTTAYGGVDQGGTAFSITTSGYLIVLHSFGGGTNSGIYPYAPLLNVSYDFFGTTSSGGAYGKGTMFSMTPNGNETVIHNFGYQFDGATPLGGLIPVRGLQYGTTSAGGTYGEGTVFALP